MPRMPSVNFIPLHSEQKRIIQGIEKLNVLRCGRRFGKTTLLEEFAAAKAIRGQKVGWFAPSYKLIHPSYSRVNERIAPVRKSASKVDGLITTKTGGHFEVWTLDNEDAGRSRFYDWVLVDEASLKLKGLRDIWEQSIRPTLLDRNGRAIMAGTPKGIDPDNFFWEICNDKSLNWKEFHAPTHKNPNLSAEALAELKDQYPPLVYQQEFMAEFIDWSGTAFFSEISLLVDGQPIPYPQKCDQVYAVVDTALKDGLEHDGTAVTYYARNTIAGTPLMILDYDLIQIEGSLLENWLPSVLAHCEQLAAQVGARQGSVGAWVEDKASGIVLIQQAQRRGLPVHVINGDLVAMGKEGRALSVSGHVYREKVKFTDYAYDKKVNYKGKLRNHLLSQVCGFRLGTKTPHEMDLLDTFTYGVAIALGDSVGY